MQRKMKQNFTQMRKQLRGYNLSSLDLHSTFTRPSFDFNAAPPRETNPSLAFFAM